MNWLQMFVTRIPSLLLKQKEQETFEAPFVPGFFNPVLRIKRSEDVKPLSLDYLA